MEGDNLYTGSLLAFGQGETTYYCSFQANSESDGGVGCLATLLRFWYL